MRAPAAVLCVAVLLPAAWGAEVGFAEKPSAIRAGDRVRVNSAVSRETDVAVYIENAKGEIVRHLVAGALGKNPPEPLEANSLASVGRERILTVCMLGKCALSSAKGRGQWKTRCELPEYCSWSRSHLSPHQAGGQRTRAS